MLTPCGSWIARKASIWSRARARLVLIHERLYESEGTPGGSATFLGLIIGLLAAQLGGEMS